MFINYYMMSKYYDINHMYILTCFNKRLHIAQLVEHRTGIAEVRGSNPVGASEFVLGFLCNCKLLHNWEDQFNCMLLLQIYYSKESWAKFRKVFDGWIAY